MHLINDYNNNVPATVQSEHKIHQRNNSQYTIGVHARKVLPFDFELPDLSRQSERKRVIVPMSKAKK